MGFRKKRKKGSERVRKVPRGDSDISKRLPGGNLSEYKTVKLPLRRVLKGVPEMLPRVHTLVTEMHDLVTHTYQFVRLYVLCGYDPVSQEFPAVDEMLIRYSMKVLGYKEDQRGRPAKQPEFLERLTHFYRTVYQPCVQHVPTCLTGKGQILLYLEQEILTCFSNHCQEEFPRYLSRFLEATLPETEIPIELRRRFHRVLMGSSTATLTEQEEIQLASWRQTHENHLRPTEEIHKSMAYDLQSHPLLFLRGMLYMNRVLEDRNAKLFQPMPQRTSQVPRHVILDTRGILEYFLSTDQCRSVLEKNDTKSKLLRNVGSTEVQTMVWKAFLGREDKVFRDRNYEFHHLIRTDGVSCSLLFHKKDPEGDMEGPAAKRPCIVEDARDATGGNPFVDPICPKSDRFLHIEELSEVQRETLRTRNVVGCDPGKRNIVFLVDETQGKTLRYTAAQRRRESKASRGTWVLLQEKRRHSVDGRTVEEVETEFSRGSYSARTMKVATYMEYLYARSCMTKVTRPFYERLTWRKMRFRQYSYGRKSLDSFLNRLEAAFGKEIVIGYGNWSPSSQMRGCAPSLQKGLRKVIHRRFDTVTVDEYKTSRLCCLCHQPLVHPRVTSVDAIGNPKVTQCHRLQTCPECVRCENKTVFWSRDVNSAVNLRNLTRAWLDTHQRIPAFARRTPTFTFATIP